MKAISIAKLAMVGLTAGSGLGNAGSGLEGEEYLRYYGPLKAFNDKTWVPNDVELVR